jgi:nitrogen fixation/metabolism regulation signal transduction histidine kinase
MVKERRKLINYSIKRQMQLRLLGRVMAVVLISLGLAAVIFYLYSDQEVGRSFKEFHVHARNFLDFLLPVVIVTFFLGVFAASGLAVFFPHRIAGPLYRFERDLKEKVGGGDLTVSFSVRKGDELRELADALNIMRERLRLKLEKIQRVSEELTTLSNQETFPEKLTELGSKMEEAIKEFRL